MFRDIVLFSTHVTALDSIGTARRLARLPCGTVCYDVSITYKYVIVHAEGYERLDRLMRILDLLKSYQACWCVKLACSPATCAKAEVCKHKSGETHLWLLKLPDTWFSYEGHNDLFGLYLLTHQSNWNEVSGTTDSSVFSIMKLDWFSWKESQMIIAMSSKSSRFHCDVFLSHRFSEYSIEMRLLGDPEVYKVVSRSLD